MTPLMRLVFVGAGGQARETAEYAEALGHDVVGFVVTDLASLGSHDSPVLGDHRWLAEHRERFDGIVCAIGDAKARARVSAMLEAQFPDPALWPVLIHPRAYVSKSSRVGHGSIISPLGAISANVVLEPFVIVNAAGIGHEAVIGRASTVCPYALIGGGARIGAAVWIGSGAQVQQYLTVGDGAAIGAGTVVHRDVAAGETVAGVPARRLGRAG